MLHYASYYAVEGSNPGDVKHWEKMATGKMFLSKLTCIRITVDMTLNFIL